MRKRVELAIFLGVFLIFSLSIVSASIFSNLWGKITGNAISGNSCSDYDGKDNFLSASQTKFNNNNYYDYCYGNTVYDYFCKGSSTTETQTEGAKAGMTANAISDSTSLSLSQTFIDCWNYGSNYACENGACVVSNKTNASCTDKDSGLNYYVSSYIEGRSDLGSYYAMKDSCEDMVVLAEKYCSGPQPLTARYNCTYGCNYDACYTNLTCLDSDSGLNYNKKGTTGYVKNGIPDFVSDSCNYYNLSNTLGEYYCLPNGTRGVQPYTCPNGCFNGACKASNQTNQTGSCTDSDGGINVNNFGRIYGYDNYGLFYNISDRCVNSTLLWETYCSEGKYNASYFANCPNGCLNGACKASNQTNNTNTCMDTDGGVNGNISGRVFGNYTNGSSFSINDFCLGNQNKVIEEFCSSNLPNNVLLNCTYGCQNGACLVSNQTNASCTDSDGGNANVFGWVYGYNNLGQFYNLSDVCVPNSSIREQVCSGTRPEPVYIECPNGCSNGVCVSNKTNLSSSSTCSPTLAFFGISATNSVYDKTPVQVILQGEGCDGKTVSFEVWKDNFFLIGDNSLTNLRGQNPDPVFFRGNVALGTWIAEYHNNFLGGTPQYYFNAFVDGKKIKSVGSLGVISNTKNETHSVCLSSQCVSMPGPGTNECTNDVQCVSGSIELPDLR
jgi:hypothetical protein